MLPIRAASTHPTASTHFHCKHTFPLQAHIPHHQGRNKGLSGVSVRGAGVSKTAAAQAAATRKTTVVVEDFYRFQKKEKARNGMCVGVWYVWVRWVWYALLAYAACVYSIHCVIHFVCTSWTALHMHLSSTITHVHQ